MSVSAFLSSVAMVRRRASTRNDPETRQQQKCTICVYVFGFFFQATDMKSGNNSDTNPVILMT